MALWFGVPDLPRGLEPVGDGVVAPALRACEMVEFRRGADLSRVAGEIMSHPYVRVSAAVGSGKSTRLPVQLAKASRQLVVYVTASPLLAYDVMNITQKVLVDSGEGVLLHRYTPALAASMPKSGVLYCGAGEYVSMMIKLSRGLVDKFQHTVFLDEAHRSDTWTYVVSKLCLAVGASRLVEASATFEMASAMRRETPSVVSDVEYVREGTMADWNTDEVGKPWSVTRVSNNVLVFTDSRKEAEALEREYENQGFSVHRLTARMTELEYAAAKSDAADRRARMVALIADSTFRDGFSFDCSVAIDSGMVGYYVYRFGVVEKHSRPLFRYERVQTSGRLGRGSVGATYYYPVGPYPAKMCDLEAVEMEAAAYVFRLLGFRPSGALATACMSRMDLPVTTDFSNAVNGPYPLQHYCLDGEGRPRTPPPVYLSDTASVVSETGRVCLTRSNSVSSGRKCVVPDGVEDVRAPVASVASALGDVGLDDGFRFLYDAMYEHGNMDVVVVGSGDYCVLHALNDVQPDLGTFPAGVGSVDRFLPPDSNFEQLASRLRRYPLHMQDQMLKLCVDSYNTVNAQVRAYATVAARLRSDGVDCSSVSEGFYDRVTSIAEEAAECKCIRDVMLRRIQVLSAGRYSLDLWKDSTPTESKLADEVYAGLSNVARVREPVDKPRDDLGFIESAIKNVALGDYDRARLRGGRRRRSARSGDVEIIRRDGPAWCGLESAVGYFDHDGVRRLDLNFNRVARFVTGRRSVSYSLETERTIGYG